MNLYRVLCIHQYTIDIVSGYPPIHLTHTIKMPLFFSSLKRKCDVSRITSKSGTSISFPDA